MGDRAAEISAGLERVRERIASAATSVGRDPGEVHLVVVTKFFPASDVRLLLDQGACDVGENRHQEAQEKAAEVSDPRARWHFVGGLQSNKAAAVAGYAAVVHSVDRRKLVRGLARGAADRAEPLDCLVQVSLEAPDAGPESGGGRQGADPADVPGIAEAIAGENALRLRGMMAVAPLGEDPAAAFDRLAAQTARLRSDHPDASWVSAGMSGDLEQAVAAGATHVRVGSAVLGERPGTQ